MLIFISLLEGEKIRARIYNYNILNNFIHVHAPMNPNDYSSQNTPQNITRATLNAGKTMKFNDLS